ncbi:MAG: cobyrinic acid a,c-diamide synthase [Actinomycetia bacterium]|nr:cobyrinic acid a,c-diamide synthase [Actinomycetes bacterium]
MLALMSVKGGVGKTTAAVNLAYLAAIGGARTLLWDLDPQGASTFVLRADDVPGTERSTAADVSITDYDRLDVLCNARDPGDENQLVEGAFVSGLARVAPWYDIVIFDCAAGCDEQTAGVVRAADALLVPVLPTPLGVRTIEQLDRFVARTAGAAHEAAPAVMPFFSLVDRRRRLHCDTVEQVQLARPATLSAQIVDSAVVERMGVRRKPVVAFAPTSGVAEAYRALWSELLQRLPARPSPSTSNGSRIA